MGYKGINCCPTAIEGIDEINTDFFQLKIVVV